MWRPKTKLFFVSSPREPVVKAKKFLIHRTLLDDFLQEADLSTISMVSSGAGVRGLASAAPITEAPPVDPKLTGMGALPFSWYDGAVPDLELFGDGAPLETDEVASAPDVSGTRRPTFILWRQTGTLCVRRGVHLTPSSPPMQIPSCGDFLPFLFVCIVGCLPPTSPPACPHAGTHTQRIPPSSHACLDKV